MSELSWYRLLNEREIYSPALLVYPERIERNLRRAVEIVGDANRLRPHVKTHKMADVVRMQLASGVTKFKCATIAEAEMTAAAGAHEVLLAYAPVGPNIDRWVRLIQLYPQVQFAALVDDSRAVAALGAGLSAANLTCEVFIDLDVGMGRTGVEIGDPAFEVYTAIARTPGLVPGGFHVYDGHIVDPSLAVREEQTAAVMQSVDAFQGRVEDAGMVVPRVICGGTPTFAIHARDPNRECSPGTTAFWDAGYGGKYPELPFEPAALLLTRVISKPRSGRLCLDLGYKAVSPDQPHPRVQFLDVPDAKAVVHSEEHLVIETSLADQFAVGDALYGIPQHICPTVALHKEAVVVRDHQAVDRWQVTARDRMLTV
jgi:D-serine deaminase-like pyridoxal phosphate-dependent protein